MRLRTNTVTKEIRACPVDGCEQEGDTILYPGLCTKHRDEYALSPEGKKAARVRAEQQARFLARLNGTKARCCINCGRWGTSEDIVLAGPEGGEEPVCEDRQACDLGAIGRVWGKDEPTSEGR